MLEIRPAYPEEKLQEDVEAVFELINRVPFCETSTHGPPRLTTTNNPVAHRCGLPHERDHEQDKLFLYPQYLKADDTCFTKEVGQDVSSFFVKRNLFISLFCPDKAVGGVSEPGLAIEIAEVRNAELEVLPTKEIAETGNPPESVAEVPNAMESSEELPTQAKEVSGVGDRTQGEVLPVQAVDVLPYLKSCAAQSPKRRASSLNPIA
jgi:hypothetical protein